MAKIIFIILLLLPFLANSPLSDTRAPLISARKEVDYIAKFCQPPSQREQTLPNGTRADCLSKTHAIEFEFANRWQRGVGQALNYAQQTGLKAKIILICKKVSDSRHMGKLLGLVAYYKLPITVDAINCLRH